MEDLVFRPLFLRIARLAKAPLSGEARFFSARKDALESLTALYFFLRGPGSDPEFLPDGRGLRDPSRQGLSLGLGPPDSPDAPEWEGRGEFISADALWCFSMGKSDLLFRKEGGRERERLVLPEGDGSRYARIDERESEAEGRESRILTEAIRRRTAALVAGMPR